MSWFEIMKNWRIQILEIRKDGICVGSCPSGRESQSPCLPVWNFRIIDKTSFSFSIADWAEHESPIPIFISRVCSPKYSVKEIWTISKLFMSGSENSCFTASSECKRKTKWSKPDRHDPRASAYNDLLGGHFVAQGLCGPLTFYKNSAMDHLGLGAFPKPFFFLLINWSNFLFKLTPFIF